MDLISLLITIIVLGIVFYLVWWLLTKLPLPAPFNVVAQALVALIAVVILLSLLFGGLTLPTFRLR